MSAYKVETPGQLRLLAEALKDSTKKKSARELASVWDIFLKYAPTKEFPEPVTLKLETEAELFHTKNGVEMSMGKLYMCPAKDVAKSLKELTEP